MDNLIIQPTIADKANYLARHGKIWHRRNDNKSGTNYTKYYSYNGYGFAVVFFDNQPVQIIKMGLNEVLTIAKAAEIEFGGF